LIWGCKGQKILKIDRFGYALFAAALVVFSRPMPAFAQQDPKILQDLATDLEDLSEDLGGAMSFVASIGLNWSDSYIGQLIDIPPHWGFGLTIGTTTLKLDKLNPVVKWFDYECDEEFMGKQLLPAYILESRIGGFRTAPFDIGIKWGLLPDAPLFKNDISYSTCLYGVDFRWELMRDWGRPAALSIGFEADRITGGMRRKSAVSFKDSESASNDIITIGGEGTAGVVWEAWVFNGKIQASKRFWEPRFTLYAGLRLGASITKSGIRLEGGSDILVVDPEDPTNKKYLEDMSNKKLSELGTYYDSQAGNNMSFVVTDNSITGWIDGLSVNFSTYEGVAFNFDNKTSLDISVMVDFMHFELGANISYRFQQ
jgi:hypothetical protein